MGNNELSKARVLQLSNWYPPDKGGIESVLTNLVPELRRHLHVEAITTSRTNRQQLDCVAGVRVLRLPPVLTVRACPIIPGLARAIRKTPADIVHVHHPHPMGVLGLIQANHPGRWVCTWHAEVVRQRLLKWMFEPFLRRFLNRCSRIVVSAEGNARCSPTLKHYLDKIHVIPFGIDLTEFDGISSRAVDAIKAEHGPRIVLAVGRLVYYKGFEYLIQAMRHVNAICLIIGDGPLRPRFEKLIAGLNLSNRVHLLGWVADAKPYFRACDLFAFPSTEISEAFGMVQLEAMACGKPVVNTQLASGVPWVSPNGLTGVTVPPRDENALATAIRGLLADRSRCDAYGKAARDRVERVFDRRLMVAETLKLYGSILNCSVDSSSYERPLNCAE